MIKGRFWRTKHAFGELSNDGMIVDRPIHHRIIIVVLGKLGEQHPFLNPHVVFLLGPELTEAVPHLDSVTTFRAAQQLTDT
jgi:hypothetical protein